MDRSMPTVLIIIFHLESNLYNISPKHVNVEIYEGWDFNSGNYLFTTDTK